MLGKINLTREEGELLCAIDFALAGDYASRIASLHAARDLTLMLRKRKAIPAIRLAYFLDPEYNVGSRRSRKEVFEHNGTRGDAILVHPHFLEYLRYFVFGPDLPQEMIDGFAKVAGDTFATTGEVLAEVRRLARPAIRSRRLERRKAAEEFFKLAIEHKEVSDRAWDIRDTVLRLR